MNGDELTLLYERTQRLVSAVFDSSSLSKKSEQEIDVPQLKVLRPSASITEFRVELTKRRASC